MPDLTKYSFALFTSDRTVDLPHLWRNWRWKDKGDEECHMHMLSQELVRIAFWEGKRIYIASPFPTQSFEKKVRGSLSHLNKIYHPLNYLQTSSYMKHLQTIFHHSRDDILFFNFSSYLIKFVFPLQPPSATILLWCTNGPGKNSAQECTPAFQHSDHYR